MEVFANREEESRFLDCLLNDQYETVLVIWGVNQLFSILKWYQYTGNEAGTNLVIKCIEDHLDREFQNLFSSGE